VIYSRELLVCHVPYGVAYLPVRGRQRHSREEPAIARGLVGSESNVLISSNNGVSAKIPPSALHVRVEVWLWDVRTYS
jgi:hypothetical protein